MRNALSRKKRSFMIFYFQKLLLFTRPAFSRNAAFCWFVISVVGLTMRSDTYGVSSIIRVLFLTPHCYTSLLHFFHSSAWCVVTFLPYWWLWVLRQSIERRVNDRIALLGDHTKNVKDGRKIPEVQTLHQDSETSSKPSFFRGHHWGFIGLLTSVKNKFWCTPLWAEIHKGTLDEKRSTRIVTMAKMILHNIHEKGYLVLDAFFSVGPVFLAARTTTVSDLHIVTRAKKNVTAYFPAKKKKKGKRGRSPKYGKKFKLMKLFDYACKQFRFSTMNAEIYGCMENIRYLELNLLWRPVKDFVRFILIESSHGRIIIMTTDLTLNADAAIFLYCRRASIETLFNSLKNLLGGFRYHFWSKYLHPSSRKPLKKTAPEQVSRNPVKTKITLEAIEKFVTIHIVIIGVLQMMALQFPKEIISKANCWMRTPPKNIPSEFMAKIALANVLNTNIIGFAKNMITQIILIKRQNSLKSNYFMKRPS
jgi:hypothetical protein